MSLSSSKTLRATTNKPPQFLKPAPQSWVEILETSLMVKYVLVRLQKCVFLCRHRFVFNTMIPYIFCLKEP